MLQNRYKIVKDRQGSLRNEKLKICTPHFAQKSCVPHTPQQYLLTHLAQSMNATQTAFKLKITSYGAHVHTPKVKTIQLHL